MDDKLIKKLSRQVRVLNVFLVIFSLIFLIVLAVTGFVAYRAMQEVQDARATLDSLQRDARDNLTIRDDLCETTGTLNTLLRQQSDLCE